MSTQYEFTVPPDGTIPIVLPEKYRGEKVKISVTPKSKPIPSDDDFWRNPTLEEIDAEQGGPKVCTDPRKLSTGFPKIWDTPEEMEDFLKRREDDI